MTCSTCSRSGRCLASNQACERPEPTPAPRMKLPRMFRPSLTVTGPFRRRRPLLRRLFAALFRRPH